MNNQTLRNAENEDKKFLERCKTMREVMDKENTTNFIFASKYTAAVKRQSMELTRALAEMRKP